MTVQPTFHDSVRERLVEAEHRLTTLEAEVVRLRSLVNAYRTIAEHEIGPRPAAPVNPEPLGQPQVRIAMPPRLDRFQEVSIREAMLTLAREWGESPHHADQFAAAIWTINTPAELRQVKRTLNSELNRATKAGTLHRVGRRRFVRAGPPAVVPNIAGGAMT